MVKVQYLGMAPNCVEGFPKHEKRTFSGALHLRPNHIYDISEEEFDFIKKSEPELKFYQFKTGGQVIRPKKVVAKKEVKKEEPKKAEVKAPVESKKK